MIILSSFWLEDLSKFQIKMDPLDDDVTTEYRLATILVFKDYAKLTSPFDIGRTVFWIEFHASPQIEVRNEAFGIGYPEYIQ